MNKIKSDLIALLSTTIDFDNSMEHARLLNKCLKALYELKEKVRAKEEFMKTFDKIRIEVVFDIIPHLYERNEDGINKEDLHTEFVHNITELLLGYGPVPSFWDNTYESLCYKLEI